MTSVATFFNVPKRGLPLLPPLSHRQHELVKLECQDLSELTKIEALKCMIPTAWTRDMGTYGLDSVRGQHSKKNNVHMEVDCAEGRTEQSQTEKATQVWTL